METNIILELIKVYLVEHKVKSDFVIDKNHPNLSYLRIRTGTYDRWDFDQYITITHRIKTLITVPHSTKTLELRPENSTYFENLLTIVEQNINRCYLV